MQAGPEELLRDAAVSPPKRKGPFSKPSGRARKQPGSPPNRGTQSLMTQFVKSGASRAHACVEARQPHDPSLYASVIVILR